MLCCRLTYNFLQFCVRSDPKLSQRYPKVVYYDVNNKATGNRRIQDERVYNEYKNVNIKATCNDATNIFVNCWQEICHKS